MAKINQLKALTKVEEEIMSVIWQLRYCQLKDILAKIDQPGVPSSTISSVVRILEKKGFIDHTMIGRNFEYFPIVTLDDYKLFLVNNLVEMYFGSSPKIFHQFLVTKKIISS